MRRSGAARASRPPQLLTMAAVAFAACATTACATLTPATAAGNREIQRADSAVRASLRRERSIDVAAIPSRAVAVSPFIVSGEDAFQALGFGLADLLATDLAKSSQLSVLERANLGALFRELQFSSGSRVDSATAPRIGRLLGARHLVTGTVRQRERELSFSSVITDIASSERKPSGSETAPENEILDAEKRLAFKIFDDLGVNLSPAERQAVEERPTRHLGALLAYTAACVVVLGLTIAADGRPNFWAFFGVFTVVLVTHNMIIPNMNAAAMMPVGHVAGTAAAMIAMLSTVGGAIIGSRIDGMFDGTVGPSSAAFVISAFVALALVLWARRSEQTPRSQAS